MSASKFLKWLSCSFATFSAIVVALFCLHLGQPWWPHHHNREVRIAKHHIAESVEGPTIWLQGGSSTWFGFDSELLSSRTGYQVVNLAFNVTMPSEFCFDEIKRFAKPNDIVILPLENSMYFRDYYSNYAANELAIWAPDFFWDLTWKRKAMYLKYLSWRKVIAGVFARFGQITGSFKNQLKPLEPGQVVANAKAHWNGDYQGDVPAYYNYLTINRYGDFEHSNHALWRGLHDYNLMGTRPISEMTREDLTQFVNWTRSNNIRVFMSWIPMARNEKLNLDHPNAVATISRIRSFTDSLNLNFLGNPEDFLVEIEDLYDTSHHLTAEAARRHTETLIPILNKAIANTGDSNPSSSN
ncbi:MAG: hypothetical protein HN457_13960 [Opitutales bacterium]|jgi:hypothetical protein|nr:hypothetical protein [Opitutales bacterium]MDG2256797.1 hypothetical protein [Opitutaceae bacterium]MBT5167717.1 hypothetical protein [Opitutales bacterium]MBT5816516.1 hypothetical protein [Opitutales bacterium]MBT6379692.1 hypothetical protein [Opitutales bacterium]